MGIERSAIIGTHKTRASLFFIWLFFQVAPTKPFNGVTQTKVVSSGLPSRVIGRVFNSIPKWGKSGSGFEPALAPSTFSRSSPTQPFSFLRSLGTTMPSATATSPKVKPDKLCALVKSAFSSCGILMLIAMESYSV